MDEIEGDAVTTILDRIRAANKAAKISKANIRKGQATAQMPSVKKYANGTIPPKKTA